jgi:hypothetical protein
MQRFSLRDMFWLVLVVGISLTWWLDRQRSAQAYLDLQLKSLSLIPPPYPRKEVEIELLKERNESLQAELDSLRKVEGDVAPPPN